jgi:predicted transcriptional regulator
MGGPGSGPRPDLKRRERVAILRALGLPGTEIARRLGVSHQAVYRVLADLERAGLVPALDMRRLGRRRHLDQTAALWEAGVPASDISRRLGISRQAVYQNLQALERNGRGTARKARQKRPPKRG